MTSLVHLGDFHAAPGPRNAQRYQALDQAIEDAAIRLIPTLGAWLWPGDLNHQRMSIEDRNALIDRVQRMATYAPVVICYGNHDLPGDLDVFAKLWAKFPVYVIDTPQCVRVRLATDEHATIFVLPYPTKGGLVAQGIAPPDTVDAAAEALDFIFMQAAGDLEAARAQGDLTLMIGHVNVGGAVTSSGQPNIGREIELSPRHLDRLGRIYKGLNHIHRGQELHGAHYAGSICRLDWGEVEEKRWIEVKCEQDPVISPAADAWVYKAVSHLLDIPPMHHIDGTLARDGFTFHTPVDENGYAIDDFGGREVRVRYTYKQSEKDVLDHESVKVPFKTALRLHVEGLAVPDRALRAPAVAQAHTLPDKLAAWADTTGTVASARLLDKLSRLEHSDPLVLLTEIQRDLATVDTVEEEAVTA